MLIHVLSVVLGGGGSWDKIYWLCNWL